jgi:hypothetical protein
METVLRCQVFLTILRQKISSTAGLLDWGTVEAVCFTFVLSLPVLSYVEVVEGVVLYRQEFLCILEFGYGTD